MIKKCLSLLVLIFSIIFGIAYYGSLYTPPPLTEDDLKPVDHYLKLSDGRYLVWTEIGPSDGIPVLLFPGIPGGPSSARIWEKDFQRLKVKCISATIFPTGYTSFKPGASTPMDYIGAYVELLNHLKISKLPIVGGSYGSMWSMALAHAYPERVSKMLLLGPIVPRSYWEKLQAVNKTLPDIQTLMSLSNYPILMNTIMAMVEISALQNTTEFWQTNLKGCTEEELAFLQSPEIHKIFIESLEEFFQPNVLPFSRLAQAYLMMFNDWGFDMSKVKVPTIAMTGEFDTVHLPDFIYFLKKNNPDMVTDYIIPNGGRVSFFIHFGNYLEKLIK